MKTTKKLWLAIGVLVLISPLGIILPTLFGAGSAWGEWNLDEIVKEVGFMPEGMKRISELWSAPFPDYAPFAGKEVAVESMGYVLSGIIGVVMVAIVMYGITKLIAGKDDPT